MTSSESPGPPYAQHSASVPFSKTALRAALGTSEWVNAQWDIWSRSDMYVKSLAEAQAIEDLEERVKQVTLWEKYSSERPWRGYFENEEGEKHVQLDPIEISPGARAVFQNDCRLLAVNVKCGNCGEYNTIPICGEGEGHRRVCPGCSQSDASRRGLKAAHMIYRFNWKALGFCEVTTPNDWVDPDRVDDIDYVNQRYDDFMLGVQKLFKESFPGHPCVMSFHHWHTKKPMSDIHFHAHIVFPWTSYLMKRSGETISEASDFWIPQDIYDYTDRLNEGKGRERYIRLYDRYKQQWLNYPLTLEFLRWRVEHFLKLKEGDGQFYYQFLQRGFDEASRSVAWRVLVHRLSYQFRGYIQDVNDWLLEGNEELPDNFPDAENWKWFQWHMRITYYHQDDEGTDYLLDEWKRRTRYLGAWHSTRINKWIEWGTKQKAETGLLGFYDHLKAASKRYCWNCKMELDTDRETLKTCKEVAFEKSAAPYKLIVDRPPPTPLMRKLE